MCESACVYVRVYIVFLTEMNLVALYLTCDGASYWIEN